MKLTDLFKPKIVEKIVYKEPEIRQGWFVLEAGQNPLCCFWYCILMAFDLKDDDGNAKSVYVEDCDTFNEAITLANRKAEEMEKSFWKENLIR